MRATELPPADGARSAPTRSPDRRELDREFAAVVFEWAAAGVHIDRPAALALRRRVEALCASCVDVVIVSDRDPAVLDDRLRARPHGAGRLLLVSIPSGEVRQVTAGESSVLRRWADPSATGAAMGAIVDELAAVGVGPGLVLVVGDDFGGRDARLLVPAAARAVVLSVGDEPGGVPDEVRRVGGGPATLRSVLDAVLARREQRRTPSIDADPAWVVPAASGDVGGQPPAPGLTTLRLAPPLADELRQLDLRSGILLATERSDDDVPLRTARLASQAIPGLMLMRAECAPNRMTPGPALAARDTRRESRGHLRRWRATARGDDGVWIHAVGTQHERRGRTVHVLDRLAVYTANSQTEAGPLPDRLLDAADQLGFDRLLAAHRAAAGRRWEAVDVRIPADPDVQLAARFALFQLWSHAVPHEAAREAIGPEFGGYGPRTLDGSPSPAITAARLARAGRADEARGLLRIAIGVGDGDRTGSCAAGSDLATHAELWRALLFGFIGARVDGTTLHLDPRLPAAWTQLEIRFLALSRHIRFRVDGGDAFVWSDGPLQVRLAGHRDADLPGETEVRLRGGAPNDE